MTSVAASAPLPHVRSRLSVDWVSSLLLLLFVIGYYLYADLPISGSLRLPAAGAVLGGLGLLAWHFGYMRRAEL
jgi:hypothetical protein